MRSILVAAAEPATIASVSRHLAGEYRVEAAASRAACLEALAAHRPEAAFVDLPFLCEDGRSGAEALAPFRRRHPGLPLVVLCTPDRIRQAVALVQAGAENYLVRPIDPAEAALVLEGLHRRHRMASELSYLRESFWKAEARDLVRTNSEAMRGVLEKVESVAATRATVLISGETGTGKSLLARLIHLHSNRAAAPFLAVHCGSIPDTLVESEFFGHEKGAFTGAERRRLGKFEIAHKGTIFLDEIGTISPAAQIRLLQVLQEGTFSRVGGEATIQVDVRVVAASNTDLAQRMAEGAFRGDLYHRLNVFAIELPPLRERREDIPLLVESLLARLEQSYGKGLTGVEDRVLEALLAYHWPGNIRELENLLERACILERGPRLGAASFPAELLALAGGGRREDAAEALTLPLAEARQRAVDALERRYLAALLSRHQGRMAPSAAQAGLTPRQLRNLLAKHGLSRKDFRPA
jgi:DNA-binding NtrC family response regulator